MYTVGLKRDFIARHFLVGGDWGEENKPHAHHYEVEVELEGHELDRHGYLSDLCDIESVLDNQVDHYSDKLLNEMAEFKDLNPSLEHLAAIICNAVAKCAQTRHLTALTVKLWENESAWATFRKEF
jgi:6-pyruvoyltetrahydropterin/6-carboxytetrahydropterin synthase